VGPVSIGLACASLLVIYLTRRAEDRTVVALAWCLFASLVISLAVHAIFHPLGRATPLMLLDGAALYVSGLLAICRFDGPKWLYVFCTALVAQCLAHLAYVCELLGGNLYLMTLNGLFVAELATLVAGSARDRPRSPAVGWRRMSVPALASPLPQPKFV
jgi:hypothetical protein